MGIRSAIWGGIKTEQRRYPRIACHVPAVIATLGARGATLYSTTEDLSHVGFSAILPGHFSVGHEMGFLLGTPVGEVKGRARVHRATPHPLAGQEYTFCFIRFTQLDGPGRAAIETMVDPHRAPGMSVITQPQPASWHVPVLKPFLLFLLALVPIIAPTLGLFRYLYREEFFLAQLRSGRKELTEENVDRLEAIYAKTLDETYPSNDRLVQLMGALTAAGKTSDEELRKKFDDQIDQITLLLAPRDRRNLDLQIALAQSLDNVQDYGQAEKQYQVLLVNLTKGRIPPERRRDVLLAAARNRVHAGKTDKADEFFRELLEEDPGNHALRNEFAGSLMSAEKFGEAISLYAGVQPDVDGRKLLIAAHTHLQNWKAAEDECRELVRVEPEDLEAQLLLADIMSWKKEGSYDAPKAIYERLAKIKGGDPKLRLRLAQIALWGKHYDEALIRFQDLLSDPGKGAFSPQERRTVERGFVDSAGNVPKEKLGEEQRSTIRAIRDRATQIAGNDAGLLAQLAWVLTKIDEPQSAAALLDQALSLNPTDPTLRNQLFVVLMQAGRKDDATRLVAGRPLGKGERQMLIGYYIDPKVQNFAAAIEEQRKIVAENPADVRERRTLADYLSWGREFDEALKIYKELASVDPKEFLSSKREDPVPDPVPVRIAEITLWSGACEEAVKLFEGLLKSNFDQPKLWAGLVDAAAGLKTPPDAGTKQLLARIADTLTGTAPVQKDVKVSAARLSWVLMQACNDKPRADAMLARAQLRPPPLSQPADRKELAGVLAASGNFVAAIALYEGLKLDAVDRRELIRLDLGAGAKTENPKYYAAAEEQCRTLLEERPQDLELRRLLADVLSQKKDYSGALAVLDQLIKEYPEDHTLIAQRCEVRTWGGAYDESLQEMQHLLAMNMNQPKLYRAFIDAAASADKGKLDDATAQVVLRIHDVALAASPAEQKELKLSWPRMAWVLVRLGQEAQAKTLLERLYKDPPTDPKERAELVDVLTAAKMFDNAVVLMEEVARQSPKDPQVQARLAEVLLWANQGERSVAIYQQLLDNNVDQALLWSGFIDAAATAKTLPEGVGELALRIAERQRNVTKENFDFLARLAWVLHRADKRDAERQILERLVAVRPDDPKVLDTLVGLLETAGQFKDAIALYEPLLKKEPTKERVARMASLELGNKDYDKALVEHERLLETDLNQPNLWMGFAAAAANANTNTVTDKQLAIAEKIGSRLMPSEDGEHVELLFTLSWVFARASESDMAGILIDRAAVAQIKGKDAERALTLRKQVAEMLIAYGSFQRSHAVLLALVQQAPGDHDLKVRLAQVTLWSHKYDEALERFQVLLEENFGERTLWPTYVDAGASAKNCSKEQVALAKRIAEDPSTADAKDASYLSRLAWVLRRGNEVGVAGRLLDRAVALRPREAAVRRELAGVLTAADRFSDAVQLYAQLEREDKRDPDLNIRLADALIGAGDYREALERFRAMLEANFEQPEAWTGYVSAVAKAVAPPKGTVLTKGQGGPRMTDEQRKYVSRIAERVAAQPGLMNPSLLSRLAYVQLRDDKKPEEVIPLLDRAVAMNPEPPAVRRELAGILAMAGQFKQAQAMYQGMTLTRDDRFNLAKIYAADKNFAAAEKEARLVVQEDPDELAREFLADLLSWKSDFVQSREMYEQLQKAHPDDRELAIKIARVTLWDKRFEDALTQLEALLEAKLNDVELYKDFIDAAASAKSLSAKDRYLALYLYEHRDAFPREKPSEFTDSLTRLGWVLRRFKEYDRAVTLLHQVVRLQPQQRGARLQLAETLADAGRDAEAEREFNILLQSKNRAPGTE